MIYFVKFVVKLWLLCIFRIIFHDWCSIAEVRYGTGSNPPSKDIMGVRQLCFFGYLARAKPSTDYAWALHLSMWMCLQRTGSIRLADHCQHGCGQLNQTTSFRILVSSLSGDELKTSVVGASSWRHLHYTSVQGMYTMIMLLPICQLPSMPGLRACSVTQKATKNGDTKVKQKRANDS